MTDLDAPSPLPAPFAAWFAANGWSLRAHQARLLAEAEAGRSVLLVAPTGAGKTLAGFLPSLIALAGRPPARPKERRGIHTLYVSPLKALAVDVARNVERPIAAMGLPIRLETRTGDTPAHKRQRQKYDPPDILMTTPEQVALLLASREAPALFGGLTTVIFDELHALVTSKRGDLLALDLAGLRRLAPGLRAVGLSATVADPAELAAWLMPQRPDGPRVEAELVIAAAGAPPEISILASAERIPWAGHLAVHALPEVLAAVAEAKTAIVFVNTRAQAELVFQELWAANDAGLRIALHHGSLDVAQRRRVEAAMAAGGGPGGLDAVVATSTLDLGIDWGDVDLVIHVGAPKGASRLAQRIGRANHRLDEPSRALLVPANRFEVLECRAAIEANAEGAQDTPPLRSGALDVLAQHVLGTAVAAPFDADALYTEVTSALPYRDLKRARFDRVVDFVATGGYALSAYERWAKIRRTADGLWRVSNPKIAQVWRLNVGTIVEMPMLKVRLVKNPGARIPAWGGRVLGEMEEYFFETLTAGDTFLFGGEVLRFLAIREQEAIVTPAKGKDPRIPSYMGGKFPLSTHLAARVRAMIADPGRWASLPGQVREWLELQRLHSRLPRPDELMIETFPRGERFHMIVYAFEGRLAHQTLGMLLTRRMERAGLRPLGFVCNDYCLGIFAASDLGAAFAARRPALDDLFDEDMLGDDLEAWLAESALLKRTFRNCAIIAGLVERRHPGQEKNGRQMTVATDLVYDVLRSHQPDHILLEATRSDAATGLLDIRRLAEMLARVRRHIVHARLDRISPLAVPVMLEIGRESVAGGTEEILLREAAETLIAEATRR
ncbi:ligase-associated DNA damage response DEXH box helicase [Siculibacillus lacustris]|uniref:Ligase-associated DNA damage response DEXH box helicase n=1 Tax=Siculibacillus lacustris TaxID=1549641 RepID=A0A4Q9VPK2_9HYPH|nr:ligase-associated DNA damage response DEXH box helicase [Siculibacillus lacustris]TBW37153.1 ligase-associated DNA damage response DEXH box helicase [Siculibacillus lacustris]